MRKWQWLLIVALNAMTSSYNSYAEGNSALDAHTESNHDGIYSNYYFHDTNGSRKINWHDIVSEMSAAIKADPTNASAYERLAAGYAATGRIEEALKVYSTAIRLNPTNWENFFNRGTIHRLKHELYEAVPDYGEALRLNPTNALVYKNRAALYDRIGNFKRAIEDWDKGLRLDPNDPGAFIARGRARQNTGDYEGARRDFNDAIRLDPGDASAYNDLAWLSATCPSAKIRNGSLAVKYATKACELTTGGDWKKLDTLAAAFAEAGDFGTAVDFQRRVIKLVQSNAIDHEIALHHLKLYEQMQPIRDLGESQF